MPIEGSLREFALHDIIQLLRFSRKTGALELLREPSGQRGVVVFRDGAVVGADLGEEKPRLGYMLLNAGKITEADLQRAGELRAREPQRGWGEIFNSLAVMEPEDLEQYMKFQVEEFVYEILDWQDGHFSFAERPVEGRECVTWIPVESLLMEGARRRDELSALSAAIDIPRSVPRLSERAATEHTLLDLTPEEWEVLGRVDGTSDVKSIATTLGQSEFEISKTMSRLAAQGLVEIASHDPTRTRPPHVMVLERAEELIRQRELDAARAQVESVLGDQPEEPRAHFLAARILESQGELGAAAAVYERTLKLDPLAEDARRRLGLVRLQLGDLPAAEREWTVYLRMTHDSPERRRVERAMTLLRDLQLVVSEFDGREHS
jgi:tetratricopeptide (TPR) repeat protein